MLPRYPYACPSCGGLFPTDAVFCSHCGQKRAGQAQDSLPQRALSPGRSSHESLNASPRQKTLGLASESMPVSPASPSNSPLRYSPLGESGRGAGGCHVPPSWLGMSWPAMPETKKELDSPRVHSLGLSPEETPRSMRAFLHQDSQNGRSHQVLGLQGMQQRSDELQGKALVAVEQNHDQRVASHLIAECAELMQFEAERKHEASVQEAKQLCSENIRLEKKCGWLQNEVGELHKAKHHTATDLQAKLHREMLEKAGHAASVSQLQGEMTVARGEIELLQQQLKIHDQKSRSVTQQLERAQAEAAISKLQQQQLEDRSAQVMRSKDAEISSLQEQLVQRSTELGPLRASMEEMRDSKAAELKFLQQAISSKTCEVSLLHRQLQDQKQLAQHLDKKLEEVTEKSDQGKLLKQQLEERSENQQLLRQQLGNLEQNSASEIQLLRQQLKEQGNHTRHTEQELDAMRRSQGFDREECNHMVRALESELESAKSAETVACEASSRNGGQIRMLQSELDESKRQVKHAEKELEYFKGSHEVSSRLASGHADEVSILKQHLEERDRKFKALGCELDEAQRSRDDASEAASSKHSELTAVQEHLQERDQKVRTLESQLASATESSRIASEATSSYSKEMALLRQECEERDQKVKALEFQLDDVQNLRRSANDDANGKKAEITQLREQLQYHDQKVKALELELDNVHLSRKDATELANNKHAELTVLQQQLRERDHRFEVLEGELDNAKKQNSLIESETASTQKDQMCALQQQLEEYVQKVKTLEYELGNVKSSHVVASESAKSKQVEISTLQEELKNRDEHIGLLNAQAEKLRHHSGAAEIKSLQEEMAALVERLDAEQHETQELQKELQETIRTYSLNFAPEEEETHEPPASVKSEHQLSLDTE
eukprot:TRINITY_DN62816_c0_g1_i1.p1 TRINITY_DN62816_c0_g1~~TRINITY_DN62816_c0_g1_i1.p1  ORF type:complete len:897 (-),score=236.52 TRINITY_DN62816_c0_g1_i1:155-2845(-)